jgi:hypothetical protein
LVPLTRRFSEAGTQSLTALRCKQYATVASRISGTTLLTAGSTATGREQLPKKTARAMPLRGFSAWLVIDKCYYKNNYNLKAAVGSEVLGLIEGAIEHG